MPKGGHELGKLCSCCWWASYEVVVCFETASLSIAPAVLELAMLTRLASNLQRPSWLCLLYASIKGAPLHLALVSLDIL